MANDKSKAIKPSDKTKKKRRSPVAFLRDVKGELKKVSWPTKPELKSAVLAVVAFTVIVAAIIAVLDLGFSELIKLIAG